MSLITRHGDPAMEFLWRHKEILAGGAALTAFLADPEPYLTGAADITRVAVGGATEISRIVAETVVKPAVFAAGNAAVETVSVVRPFIIMALISCCVMAGLAAKSGVLTSLPIKLALGLATKKAARTLFRKD